MCHRISTTLLILLLSNAGLALAERSQDFGDYVVHFNAVSTRFLAPEVASHYSIRRSPTQGLLNVTVLRKTSGAPAQPVSSSVSGYADNLTGQRTELVLREIREGAAIYTISTFRVANQETLVFNLRISPGDSEEILEVGFRQQFYAE